MSVVVRPFHPGLMHVRMGVLGSVVVSVRVLMLDVLVLMRSMRVGVGRLAMLVFMRMRSLVVVLVCHCDHLLLRGFSGPHRRLLANDA